MGEMNSKAVPEDCMSIGPWGSSEGESWTYHPQGHITEIIIRHGFCIDSVIFQSKTNDDSIATCSERFGGPGGNKTDKVIIGPKEYLTGVDVVVGQYWTQSVVNLLRIRTSVTIYGPFGTDMGTKIPISIANGQIVGFFGRAGTYLNAIGIFATVKLKSSLFPLVPQEHKIVNSVAGVPLVLRDLGPWGSQEGRPWDDGVYLAVREVCVHVRSSSSGTVLLHSVKFLYERRDGVLVSSPCYGDEGHFDTVVTTIDLSREVLTGIEGLYGRMGSEDGGERITSLTFHTNNKKYGPFGSEIGMYFSSDLSRGEVVGFLGRSGQYLNAIGVHIDYN